MRIIFCLMVFLFIGKNTMLAQQLSSFVEYGAALHTGDNTPLWQVSNQQGLTSLDNNTYIRGGISYKHQLGKWKFEEALDLVAAAGFSTTSFIVQQAYVDIRYKWFGFFAGSREQNSPLLNQELSSGGMTWSGNARPIPQVQIGIPEYVQLLPRLGLKGESRTDGLQITNTSGSKSEKNTGTPRVSNTIIKKGSCVSVYPKENGNWNSE